MSTGTELPSSDQGAHESVPPSDDIDDLFALDEGAGELRQELEAALTAVENAKQDLAIGAKPAVATLPRASVVPVAPTTAASASTPVRISDAAQRFETLKTRTILGLVVALVLLNVSLVVIVSQSSASLADAVSTMSSKPSTPEQPAPAPPDGSKAESGERPEGYRTLDLARADLERGDHAFARRRLYSLLAVVDGVEEPARKDIEARAELAVADSFRLQATALARDAQGGSR